MWPQAAPTQPVRASSGYATNGNGPQHQDSTTASWPTSHASTGLLGSAQQLGYGQQYQHTSQQQQQQPQQQQAAPSSQLPPKVNAAAAPKAEASKSSRGKRRKWSAEERHEHSVIEKKRREVFNVLLLVSVMVMLSSTKADRAFRLRISREGCPISLARDGRTSAL